MKIDYFWWQVVQRAESTFDLTRIKARFKRIKRLVQPELGMMPPTTSSIRDSKHFFGTAYQESKNQESSERKRRGVQVHFLIRRVLIMRRNIVLYHQSENPCLSS